MKAERDMGAKTLEDSRPGLRVFIDNGSGTPQEVTAPPSHRKYWMRRGLAKWLNSYSNCSTDNNGK